MLEKLSLFAAEAIVMKLKCALFSQYARTLNKTQGKI